MNGNFDGMGGLNDKNTMSNYGRNMRAGAGGMEQVDCSNMILLACYLGDLLGPFSAGP